MDNIIFDFKNDQYTILYNNEKYTFHITDKINISIPTLKINNVRFNFDSDECYEIFQQIVNFHSTLLSSK